ncbi:YicC/YloC family endoribonuclease [Ruminococcus sp.]|uniref:YicC/YloC family endoribonuclease n=1 Tax=Ruminococcus sp. TaxID=41978 RepID=UPI002636DE2F|nr:YicC/YloC family endoribonuclease [Ruminococcus sp.]MDD6989264.1 YicC family protein [Ruminococcus sp.]MDY6202118.1 YicC/YloC family endoribonuclease [Ruminococcus sp.]
MIKSMTGFGRCEAEINGREITVEIKSVNHRYFEFSCRTPRGYGFLDDKLKSYVNSRVSRGKIDMFVTVGANDEAPSQVTVNHQLVSGYINAMKEISDTYGVENDVTVVSLSRFPDVFTVHKPAEDEEQITNDVLSVAKTALDSFISMRETEGEKMKADILSRANTILSIVGEIEERSPQTVAEYEERLLERIKQTLEDYEVEIDEQRVLTEVAVFSDKVAVAEETVRLRSHFEQLGKFLEYDEPVGRKIDFIIQEMNREANTIGSKVQDAVLAHKVVDIKSEIEKIREQVQNIE